MKVGHCQLGNRLPSGASICPELRDWLSASDREIPVFTGVNGTLMARRSWPAPGWMTLRPSAARSRWLLAAGPVPLRWVTGVTVPVPLGLEDVVVYLIPPAVSGSAFSRVSKMTLLTRTKIRNSTNPMRSRTSPNEAMTPPRPKPWRKNKGVGRQPLATLVISREERERHEVVPAAPVAGRILEHLRFNLIRTAWEAQEGTGRIDGKGIVRPAVTRPAMKMTDSARPATVRGTVRSLSWSLPSSVAMSNSRLSSRTAFWRRRSENSSVRIMSRPR